MHVPIELVADEPQSETVCSVKKKNQAKASMYYGESLSTYVFSTILTRAAHPLLILVPFTTISELIKCTWKEPIL